MATKKILVDKPKPGDISQYNFPTDVDANNLTYNDSTGLPENNDKFQKKDLFTNCVGDELNEKIIEANLKFQGDSFLKIENLYISNTGVGGTVKSNRVVAWIFSEEAYGGDPTKDGYSTVKDKMKDEWRFYAQNFGSRDEDADIGNITAVEGIPIVGNFGVESSEPELGNFPGKEDEFKVETDGTIKAFALNPNEEPPPTQTTIFNEVETNPIYIVIYMRGHKKMFWPINTDERRRRYDIFKISNDDLFEIVDGTYQGTTYLTDFSGATKSKTGDGGSGVKQAAWKVTSLRLSVNTSAGSPNNFTGVSNYKEFIPEVLPKIKIDENIFNSAQWLSSLNPAIQLDNGDDAGSDSALRRHPDFIPFTNFGFSQNNRLAYNYVDLQSYNIGFDLIMKASVPLNVTFNIDIKKVQEGYPTPSLDRYDDDFGFRSFYYFIIDWNDTEEKFKTIQDWLESKPENNFDYLEKQNQNLYKIKTLNEPASFDADYLSTLPFPQYKEEFDADGNGTINSFDATIYQRDIPFPDGGLLRPDISDLIARLSVGIPASPDYIYPDYVSNWSNLYSIPNGNGSEQPLSTFINPTFNPSQTGFVSNIYTTPGIKNIKFIMFSIYNGSGDIDTSAELEVGRWKLCTSRIYLDIPPNQYPDFSDVGGSDYTTLPWPFTTPIIGGVSDDSKYKKSIQNTLGGGKIGELDIIDERLLVNDLENDEMGKNIETMDLEQVRYFNTGSYNMNTLLGVNPITNDGFRPYNYIIDSPNEIEDVLFEDVNHNDYNISNAWFGELESSGNRTGTDLYEQQKYNDDSRGIHIKYTADAISGNTWTFFRYMRNDLHNNLKTYEEGGTEYTFKFDIRFNEFSSNAPISYVFRTANRGNDYGYSYRQGDFQNGNSHFYRGVDGVYSSASFEPHLKLGDYGDWITIEETRKLISNYSSSAEGGYVDGFPNMEFLTNNWDNNSWDEGSSGNAILDFDIRNPIMLPTEIYEETTDNLLNQNRIYWDGEINKFSEETSVGQIFIGDNSDLDLKQNCKLELNTGELTGKSILDTSGNSNKGLLIGDYKVKKVKKGQSMRKDSFIKVPKKKSNTNGAL